MNPSTIYIQVGNKMLKEVKPCISVITVPSSFKIIFSIKDILYFYNSKCLYIDSCGCK